MTPPVDPSLPPAVHLDRFTAELRDLVLAEPKTLDEMGDLANRWDIFADRLKVVVLWRHRIK